MRARGIKPGVFKNEALAEIAPPWGRVLFMGLWGLADREGRLLDRPGHIAVDIFPYDLANGRLLISQIEEMLNELAKGSDPFILRYEVDGRKIIQIIKFKKHQSPHNTEKASELPEYQGVMKNKRSKKMTVDPRKSNGGNRPDSLTPDSLTPDPGLLTPDSLTPEVLTPEILTKEGSISAQELAVLWNEEAPPELARVNLPFNRAPKAMEQIKDAIERNPEKDWWSRVITRMFDSPFLRGESDGGWKANIDFMVKKAEEILDGKYDGGGRGQRAPEPKSFTSLRNYAAKRSGGQDAE